MNEQSEQSILDWLKDNLNPRGLRSLFSRRPKVDAPIAEIINTDSKEVQPEAQAQRTVTTAEPNVKLGDEVTEIVISDNEAITAKMAHVVIKADIQEGMTLNITIQTNAEGKASVSSRIIPAHVAEISKSTAVTENFNKLGKLFKRRWQWALVIGALLVYLFSVALPNFGNINNGIGGEVVQANILVGGESLELSYSPIDMGQPKDIFDADFVTLIRGASANPYILNFDFSTPRHLSGIFGQFARMDYRITVDLYPTNRDSPVRYEFTADEITTDIELEMTFDNAPEQVKRVYMEIPQLNPGEEVHIHVREIRFLP